MPKLILKGFLLVGLLVAIVTAGFLLRDYFEVSRLQAFLETLGIWAPIIFIGIYALATVLFLPGSILTLTGGFVFGPVWGLLYNMTGAVLGATIAFIIARFVASDWVEKKVGGKLKQLKQGVEKQGWKFVAIVRLIPLIPFNLLNYALGLTRVSLVAYVFASIVFMLPGGAAYTYLGHLGEAAMTGEPRAIINKVFIALSLFIILSIIPWLIKTLKNDEQ